MYIYNTLTRKKELFIPNKQGEVSMYTCGPTVYHYAHIGNLRSYIMEDILEKYLVYSGYKVNRVMNITDVGHLTGDGDDGDDKMVAGAKREHKTVAEIAKFYTDAFFADCDRLNIKKPDTVVPATSLTDEFIRVIQVLLDKGYAYISGGNVYFDTSKPEKYYVFNDFRPEDLEVGVREGVSSDENKRNSADFALWFTKSKFEDQELKWDSPWGMGYPGWHIECSCISMKYNGEYLDIHCGGVDNVFPHHTNEIAQSEAYLGHKWCNYWFHVHHLNTNDGKMSKSKGEFLTVPLLEEKGYDPMAYRFFCLQSHYRRSLVFSYENLDNAAAAYEKLIARVAALLKEEQTKTVSGRVHALTEDFRRAMDADLNTALAVTAVYDILKSDASASEKLAAIADVDSVLSLDLIRHAENLNAEGGREEPLPAEIQELADQRRRAREAKDFAVADKLRDKITALGYTVEETRQGTVIKKR